MALIPEKHKDGSKATVEDVAKLEAEQESNEIILEAEKELEEKTEERLEQVFKGEGLKEEPAEEPEKSDEPTSEPVKEPKEEPDKKGDSTPEPKDNAEEKNKDVESVAKDEDAEKGKKEEDVPQLPDAYYRAAIHRGMKPEEIEEFYQANPKLCVQTCGNIYEAVKRSNEEFATLGHAYKEREAAAKATPLKTATEAVKTEYKGVDLEALDKSDIDPDAIAIIKTMDRQMRELHEARSVQTPEQPSGPTQQESRAATQEVAAIQQQIENFFKADEIKVYKDFYGDLPKEAIDWAALSPGQKANRWAVIEMMDDLLVGAHINNRDMKIDEAMRLAHLNISESQREIVIREKLKTDVTKRSKGISLKPSSTNKSDKKTSPQTEQELIETTQERLNKLSW